MNSRNYIDKVIGSFAKNISEDVTDRIFMMIERDEKLMREYQQLIDCGTSKRGLNSRIGRRVREAFNLRNIGRCHAPTSKLIKSYERHKTG
jgi:Mg2+ and Co2+ transporter CorA